MIPFAIRFWKILFIIVWNIVELLVILKNIKHPAHIQLYKVFGVLELEYKFGD